jgi:hypothetical protein
VTFRSSSILNFFAARPELPRFYVQWLEQDKLEGKRELEWAIMFGGNIASKCAEEPLASAGLYVYREQLVLGIPLDTFGFGAHKWDGYIAVVDSG